MKASTRGFIADKIKLLAVLVTIPAVASIFGGSHHLFELTSHFRLHYAAAFALLLLIFLLIRQWRWSVFATIGVIANAAPAVPWITAPTPPPAPDSTPLRVLLSNVHTANTNTQPLLDLIRAEQPDLIVLEEVDDRWAAELKTLDASYPTSRTVPREDNFGIGIWSRIPLNEIRVVESGTYDVPTITAVATIAGQTIKLIATHPVPPASSDGATARNNHLEEVAKMANQSEIPSVIVGDLNVTMWSPYYTKFEAQSGLKNVRRGFGILPSWPVPFAMAGIPLDHCMVHSSIGVRSVRLGPNIQSDHLPLIVDLAIPRRN